MVGIRPDGRCYSAACRSLWWARRSAEAWGLIERMRAGGLAPDANFYLQMLLTTESVGMMDDADRIHRVASAEGLELAELRRRHPWRAKGKYRPGPGDASAEMLQPVPAAA